MSDTVLCDTHGEADKTYACVHLTGESVGLGFNSDDPTDDYPFPDAWCDACERIRAEHDGWNEASEKLTKIVLLCSGCYERARIRNTRPTVTLDDLTGLRWKCGSCNEWHTGPMLDAGFDHPACWSEKHAKRSRWSNLIPRALKEPSATFVDLDYCAIEDRDFFVRGLIHLPILGTAESFRWGVWGSLSRENFQKLLDADKKPERAGFEPMFSWLSNSIAGYPDTLNLKMYAHIQPPGFRPHFRLERTDHPLSHEYHHGISPERVREIMLSQLPALEQ